MVRKERLELSRRKTLEPKSSASTNSATFAQHDLRLANTLPSLTLLNKEEQTGVTDGARTHDHRNHNPGLYQLSYNHHAVRNCRNNYWYYFDSLTETYLRKLL